MSKNLSVTLNVSILLKTLWPFGTSSVSALFHWLRITTILNTSLLSLLM